MSLSLLAGVALLAAAPADPVATLPAGEFWIQAVPERSEEKALRDALAKTGGFAGPTVAIPALKQVTAMYPGTAASGLAQLAAGLLLLDSDRPAEAVPFVTHADIQQTLVFDHALFALGRAQEALHQPAAAGQSFLAAAGTDGRGPVACAALARAGNALGAAHETARAIASLERALDQCPGHEPHLLLQLAKLQEDAGDTTAAALVYDRLDREYATSAEAKEAAPRLVALAPRIPPVTDEARAARDLARGLAFFEAHRYAESATALLAYLALRSRGEEADLARVRLGRDELALGRVHDASVHLAAVEASSPYAAEADFHRGKIRAALGPVDDAYGPVARQHAGTPWGEEALVALANNYQKDARDDDALPYWRRVVAEYPDGQYAERAAWRSAWADYRAGRFDDAAAVLERTARLRPESWMTPGLLYWAGRSRAALGQNERARQLLEETVQRFKYAYHGFRAREALARLPRPATASVAPPMFVAPTPTPEDGLTLPQRTRVRQLLLIDRLEDASDELAALPYSPKVQATIAWTLWKRGKLRPAIGAMKKAYPEWISEAGERLPDDVWHILFPLEFKDTLVTKSRDSGLDPALVAALILQESTFDPQALSRAGARGLMQVIPATGRKLAHDLRVPYRHAALHDPKTSLDFGTLYLRQMMERFDGKLERVLAAYNAGPHRVDAWTATRPDMSAEEFVESIPFTETRGYVMIILSGREQYRRLYGLTPAPAPPVEGRRP